MNAKMMNVSPELSLNHSLIASSGNRFVKNAFNELTAAETVPDSHRYSLFKLAAKCGVATLWCKSRKKRGEKLGEVVMFEKGCAIAATIHLRN